MSRLLLASPADWQRPPCMSLTTSPALILISAGPSQVMLTTPGSLPLRPPAQVESAAAPELCTATGLVAPLGADAPPCADALPGADVPLLAQPASSPTAAITTIDALRFMTGKLLRLRNRHEPQSRGWLSLALTARA